MTEKENFAWAVEQLRKKTGELGRLPKKEDFDEKTRSRIKAYLGPWPRALEAAGIKEVSESRKRKLSQKAGLKGGKQPNESIR